MSTHNLFSKREIIGIYSLAILFFITIVSVNLGIFNMLPYLDIPTHFLGGFFLALFFIDFFKKALRAERTFFRDIIIIVGASLLIGVVWEIFEYILTVSQNYGNELFRIGGLADTLKDLADDSIGAGSMFLIIRHRHRNLKMFK